MVEGESISLCTWRTQKGKNLVFITQTHFNTRKTSTRFECSLTTVIVYNVHNRFTVNHKVFIYIEHHSVCPLVGIGTPPTPLSQASVPSPPDQRVGGGAHSTAAKRGGGSQFRRREKKLSTLPTLCSKLYICFNWWLTNLTAHEQFFTTVTIVQGYWWKAGFLKMSTFQPPFRCSSRFPTLLNTPLRNAAGPQYRDDISSSFCTHPYSMRRACQSKPKNGWQVVILSAGGISFPHPNIPNLMYIMYSIYAGLSADQIFSLHVESLVPQEFYILFARRINIRSSPIRRHC